MASLKLRYKFMSAQNRSSYHMRPKHDIGQVEPEVPNRIDKATIDIDSIAKGYKGVKTNTKGQSYLPKGNMPVCSKDISKCSDIVENEIGVLEIHEQP